MSCNFLEEDGKPVLSRELGPGVPLRFGQALPNQSSSVDNAWKRRQRLGTFRKRVLSPPAGKPSHWCGTRDLHPNHPAPEHPGGLKRTDTHPIPALEALTNNILLPSGTASTSLFMT